MNHDDPESRIAELERQLAEVKVAAAEKARESAPPRSPTPGTPLPPRLAQPAGPPVEQQAVERIAQLAREMADAFHERQRTGGDWGAEITKHKGEFERLQAESGLSPAQFGDVWEQAGRQAYIANEFGVEGGAGSPGGPVDTRLAEPPRRIPAAFWLAELLGFRWWYFLAIMLVGIAPMALWMNFPVAFAVVVVLTFLAIYGYQLRGTTKRFALLKWGQVAHVTGTQILSQGTYYGGTTLKNMKVPIAHGWKVMRPMYSGPNTKTRIRYTVNGSPGELTVSGREYIDGVVLADPRRPTRALCVTSFAYDLDRDESGNWIGRIRPGLMFGMALWLIVVMGWLSLAATIATDPDRTVRLLCSLPASHRGFDCSEYRSSPGNTSSTPSNTATSVPPGGELRVGGYTVQKTVACNDGNLTLYGSGTFNVTGRCANLIIGATNSQVHVEAADTITIQGYKSTISVTGHCANLTVAAYGNEVLVERADTINVSSYDNTVTYRSGSPDITDTGSGNLIGSLG